MKHCTIKFVRHQYVAFSNDGVCLAVSKDLVNLRSQLLLQGYTFTEKFSNEGTLMNAKARRRVKNFRMDGMRRMQTGEPIHSQLSAGEIAAKYGDLRNHIVAWRKGA